MEGIRIPTKIKGLTFHACPDGRLLMNGEQVGSLFPEEYERIAAVAEDYSVPQVVELPEAA